MKKSIRIFGDSFSLIEMDRKYDNIKCVKCLKTVGRNDQFHVYLGHASWADSKIGSLKNRGLCLLAKCSICDESLQIGKLKVSWFDIDWVDI